VALAQDGEGRTLPAACPAYRLAPPPSQRAAGCVATAMVPPLRDEHDRLVAPRSRSHLADVIVCSGVEAAGALTRQLQILTYYTASHPSPVPLHPHSTRSTRGAR
jgi:hypothetical protein